jgi:hypothetical protein
MMKTELLNRVDRASTTAELRAALQTIGLTDPAATSELRLVLHSLLKLVELQHQQQEATNQRLELLLAENQQLQSQIAQQPKKWTIRLNDRNR